MFIDGQALARSYRSPRYTMLESSFTSPLSLFTGLSKNPGARRLRRPSYSFSAPMLIAFVRASNWRRTPTICTAQFRRAGVRAFELPLQNLYGRGRRRLMIRIRQPKITPLCFSSASCFGPNRPGSAHPASGRPASPTHPSGSAKGPAAPPSCAWMWPRRRIGSHGITVICFEKHPSLESFSAPFLVYSGPLGESVVRSRSPIGRHPADYRSPSPCPGCSRSSCARCSAWSSGYRLSVGDIQVVELTIRFIARRAGVRDIVASKSSASVRERSRLAAVAVS